MKAKFIIAVLLSFICMEINCQDCIKCDTVPLLALSKSFEKSDYLAYKNFICTLDTSCKNNVEFSEWSNDLIFELIKKDVNLFNQALHDFGYDYVILIGEELENPTSEHDLRKIYKLIDNSIGPKDMILVEKRAILKAAENVGVEIEIN